jgi:hypothetical protein
MFLAIDSVHGLLLSDHRKNILMSQTKQGQLDQAQIHLEVPQSVASAVARHQVNDQ